MPFKDIQEAKKVWEQTRRIVEKGNIVKEVKGDRRLTNFPGMSFNSVAHVRPHGQKTNDTYPLPVPDVVTGKKNYTKQCFWLNNKYIRDEIYLK